jgi:beta-phosphoglucomutase-like phosphatase (HAD superfamily)
VDATEEALAAGFWTVLVAEVMGGARGLSLDGEDAAVRLGEGAGRGARPLIEVVVRGCHDVDLPAETLDLALARHPCTSLSALQARWNKRVTLV